MPEGLFYVMGNSRNFLLQNEKNRHVYSRKFRLSVLDLNQMELASEEDRKYKVDYWANLFKSTTWEELKMLAKSDEYIQEAVDTVYQLSQEEKIRLQCEAREDYNRRMRRMEKLLKENRQLTAEHEQVIAEKEKLEIEKAEIETAKAEMEAVKNAEIERLQQLLREHGISDK